MRRLERLGSLYGQMPDSPEKTVFLPHVSRAIKEINDWLDTEKVRIGALVESAPS